MTINCVWEHNGRDTLLYAVDFVGAYTRGETLEAAVRKMQAEICSYLKWCGKKAVTSMDIVIIEEKVSELAICDADSDVLFESEKAPLTAEEYIKLKALALKSAQDFLALYDCHFCGNNGGDDCSFYLSKNKSFTTYRYC